MVHLGWRGTCVNYSKGVTKRSLVNSRVLMVSFAYQYFKSCFTSFSFQCTHALTLKVLVILFAMCMMSSYLLLKIELLM